MKAILMLIAIVAFLAAVCSIPSGIGYALYLLSQEVAFGAAAWAGFKLWLSMFVGGNIIWVSCYALGVSK